MEHLNARETLGTHHSIVIILQRTVLRDREVAVKRGADNTTGLMFFSLYQFLAIPSAKVEKK